MAMKREKDKMVFDIEETSNDIGKALYSVFYARNGVRDVQVFQVNIKDQGYECQVMLKGFNADRDVLVCFVVGKSLDSALRKAWVAIEKNELKWRLDKFSAEGG
jgi:hypothetical protein